MVFGMQGRMNYQEKMEEFWGWKPGNVLSPSMYGFIAWRICDPVYGSKAMEIVRHGGPDIFLRSLLAGLRYYDRREPIIRELMLEWVKSPEKMGKVLNGMIGILQDDDCSESLDAILEANKPVKYPTIYRLLGALGREDASEQTKKWLVKYAVEIEYQGLRKVVSVMHRFITKPECYFERMSPDAAKDPEEMEKQDYRIQEAPQVLIEIGEMALPYLRQKNLENPNETISKIIKEIEAKANVSPEGQDTGAFTKEPEPEKSELQSMVESLSGSSPTDAGKWLKEKAIGEYRMGPQVADLICETYFGKELTEEQVEEIKAILSIIGQIDGSVLERLRWMTDGKFAPLEEVIQKLQPHVIR